MYDVSSSTPVWDTVNQYPGWYPFKIYGISVDSQGTQFPNGVVYLAAYGDGFKAVPVNQGANLLIPSGGIGYQLDNTPVIGPGKVYYYDMSGGVLNCLAAN